MSGEAPGEGKGAASPETPLLGDAKPRMSLGEKLVAHVFSLQMFQLVLIALYVAFTKYSDDPINSVRYEFYKDIAVMIFIGFGYLMTFLRKYGYGAVGYTLLASVVASQWCILVVGFFNNLNNSTWDKIPLSVGSLVQGLFGAAAVMITFGAVLGKIAPAQLTLLTVFEMAFYGLNSWIVVNKVGAFDMGGSVVIHTFGAYFGLASSLVFTPSVEERKKGEEPWNKNEASSYIADIFSLIGTVFLWIYWPSFNGAMAPCQEGGLECGQLRTTINTVLSLSASVVAAFYASRTLRGHGHFDPVDIQNASLAGGVAIGTVSDLVIHPGAALAVGTVAGWLSVYGYTTIQPLLLNSRLALHDTCGVHNLHGMPGVLGGLVSVLAAGVTTRPTYLDGVGHFTPQTQLAGLGITIAIAITAGYISARITKMIVPASDKKGENIMFNDTAWWSVPEADVAFTKNDTGDEIEGEVRHKAVRSTLGRKRLLKAVRGIIASNRLFGSVQKQ